MSTTSSQPTLGVFFTYGVSALMWKKQGMLSRELSLYEYLQKNSFEKIYFFTYGTEDPDIILELQKKGVEIKPKKSSLPNFLYSLLLPFFYKKELRECSIYKTTQMFGSWSAVFSRWLYHKPLVVRAGFALSTNLRGQKFLNKFFARIVEYFALKNADEILVTTEEIKTLYQKHNKNITVIPNFVDTNLFSPKEKTRGEQVQLLFVGRLSKEKNLESLIDAISNKKNVKLTLVGDGELKNALQQKAFDAHANVQFVGSVDHSNLPTYFASSDIFVLPSLFEGHPKVMVEAMAMGMPIVGTRVRGIESLLENNKTGVLVETPPESLWKGIQSLIENPSLCLSLGKNAREYALKEFGFENLARKEARVYKKYLTV